MHVRSPITVAIACFEDLLALGLRALLADDPSVSIVAQDIAHERISVVLRAHRPGVLILDVDALRDLAEVRELSVEHPSTRLVLLGQGLSTAESAQLLAFGASACLAKETQARDVRHAIHLASRGLQVMPLGAPDASGVHDRDSLLTRREGDVLFLLRQGRSNAQIALALQIGVETVRTHARSIHRKLGVPSAPRSARAPGTGCAAAGCGGRAPHAACPFQGSRATSAARLRQRGPRTSATPTRSLARDGQRDPTTDASRQPGDGAGAEADAAVRSRSSERVRRWFVPWRAIWPGPPLNLL